jgi:hypothetical protein
MGCGVNEKLRDLIHGQSGPARFAIDPWFDGYETISMRRMAPFGRFGKSVQRRKLEQMIREWHETEGTVNN